MEYEVTDNFLSKGDFGNLQKTMVESNTFPWYYNNYVIPDEVGKEHFQFAHVFYDFWNWNSSRELIRPIVDKINPKAWLRIKANLTTKSDSIQEQGWHTDYDFECTTAIYYLNDTNGYTSFEDGTKIECVANRLVTFNSQIKHSGTTHTDAKTRVVINMNYIKYGGL